MIRLPNGEYINPYQIASFRTTFSDLGYDSRSTETLLVVMSSGEVLRAAFGSDCEHVKKQIFASLTAAHNASHIQ